MKRFALATLLLLSAPFAQAAQPSDAQIDKLLQVMNYEEMKAGILKQMGIGMRDMAASMLPKDVSDQDRARFDRVMNQQVAFAGKLLAWENIGPIYRKVYGEVFTAEEVQAMIDFYASEQGRSLLKKMPLAMGRTMQEMQPMLQSMMVDLQKTLEKELKSGASTTATEPPSSADKP